MYKGVDIETNEVVAIKQVDNDQKDDSKSPLQREIEMLKRLDHPNIVKYYGKYFLNAF